MADTKLSDYDKQQFTSFVRGNYATWWSHQSMVQAAPIIDDLLTMAYSKKQYKALLRINDKAPEVFETMPNFNLVLPSVDEDMSGYVRFNGSHHFKGPRILAAMPGEVDFDIDHSKRVSKIVKDIMFCHRRKLIGNMFADALMDTCSTAAHLNYLVPDLIESIGGHLYTDWSGRLSIAKKVARLTGRERNSQTLPYLSHPMFREIIGVETSNVETFEYQRDQILRDMVRSDYCRKAESTKPFDQEGNHYRLTI